MAMSINFTQSVGQNIRVSSYNRRAELQAIEGQMERIDRRIAVEQEERAVIVAERDAALQKIAHKEKLIASNEKLIASNKKIIDLRTDYLKNLRESRDLMQESLNTGLEMESILEKMMLCCKKLIEIRQAKDAANTDTTVVPQKLQSNITPAAGNDKVVKAEPQTKDKVISAAVTTATQMSKAENMEVLKATATEKLGEVLFDQYKDTNKALAMNIRDRFFQELEYDSSKNIASADTSLWKTFDVFANYLQVRNYSFLKNHNNYFAELQNKLSTLSMSC